jgi:D-amino-acid dehydrogenase
MRRCAFGGLSFAGAGALDVALVARLPARGVPPQPQRDAGAGALQPPAPAGPGRHLQPGLRTGQGYMVLLRTDRDVANAQGGPEAAEGTGRPMRAAGRGTARNVEPGLNAETPWPRAIHLPQDGVGNCRHFAHLLKARRSAWVRRSASSTTCAHRAGHAAPARGAGAAGRRRVRRRGGVRRRAGQRRVCAAGPALPLAPVHGYSITAPLRCSRPPPSARARR